MTASAAQNSRTRCYVPKVGTGVLKVKELQSKRDVRLFQVKCRDTKKDNRLAWEARLELRKESHGYRLFVYGQRTGGLPKGQFARLSCVIEQKLGIELTPQKYAYFDVTTTSDPRKILQVQRQNYETGRLAKFDFDVQHISSSNLETRGVEVEFVQVNNAKIPPGEYEEIIQFLQKSSGYKRANRFPQMQLDL